MMSLIIIYVMHIIIHIYIIRDMIDFCYYNKAAVVESDISEYIAIASLAPHIFVCCSFGMYD